MKEILKQIDALLSMLEVKGDSVMILADARKALGEAYRLAREDAVSGPAGTDDTHLDADGTGG